MQKYAKQQQDQIDDDVVMQDILTLWQPQNATSSRKRIKVKSTTTPTKTPTKQSKKELTQERNHTKAFIGREHIFNPMKREYQPFLGLLQ